MNFGNKQQQQIQDNQRNSKAVPAFLTSAKKPQEQSFECINTYVESQHTQPEEIHKELEIKLKAYESLRSDRGKSNELLDFLENLTKETKFQLNESCQNDTTYIRCWIEYAGMVRDSDTVYQYALSNHIGENDHQIYLSQALYYEKFERNFIRAEEIYKNAVRIMKEEKTEAIILKKFKEFSERMQKRTDRDVVQAMGKNEYEKFKNKRKFNEAFPEINSSLDSTGSNNSRRRKINQEIKECSASIREYEEGIEYLKINDPKFEEIGVYERNKIEQESKPCSWITKERELHEQMVKQKTENQNNAKDNHEEDKKQEEFIQSNNHMPINLEPIGEISQEIGSSLANLSNYQSKVLGAASKQSESGAFKTANNSFNNNNNSILQMNDSFSLGCTQNKQDSNKTLRPQQEEQLNSIRSQFEDLFVNKCNDSKSKNVARESFAVLCNLFMKTINPNYSAGNSESNLDCCTQQTVRQFQNIPVQTQPIFNSNFIREVLPQQNIVVQQNTNVETKTEKPKQRFSGIFMDLIEKDENIRKEEQPLPYVNAQPPRNPQFSQFLGQNSINQSRYSGLSNNVINMNGSFIDGTPIEHNFGNHINPNYSRDLFYKKKTLSKTRTNNHDECDDNQCIQSPFGAVSPLVNQQSKIRKSNLMDDCNSQMLNMMIRNDNGYQNLFSQRQSTVNSNAKPALQSNTLVTNVVKQSNNSFQNNNQKRDSVDSLGQEFKECNTENCNYNASSSNYSISGKLPSALKGNNDDQSNSRNGSKSVRFK